MIMKTNATMMNNSHSPQVMSRQLMASLLVSGIVASLHVGVKFAPAREKIDD